AQPDFAAFDYRLQRRREQQERQQREREQRKAALEAEQRNVRTWLAQSAGGAEPTETMNDADSANWNKWFAESFDDRIGFVLEVLGDEVRQWIGKQADDIAARVDDLESRIQAIERRLDDLEGSGEQQKIVPMLTFKGNKDGRDAA